MSGVRQAMVPAGCLGQLLLVALAIFAHGFLLTRQVVPNTSSCGAGQGCWMPPSFNRTVILVIDALRYDFTVYNASLDPHAAAPHANKLPALWDVLARSPRQATLRPFTADAPTTTMQRLKGLTTGSLPTFIDASHNFASEEISEDNIVDQCVRHGRRVKVLGDDTWGGLFPGRFNRSLLFPSFNVMDLDSVDDGITTHLYDQLAGHDWEVLVAHFLGVDHCGHRYGPNHPQMARKLTQMNDVIKRVVPLIAEDTLLLVLGDHGMTRTGDHGGDSPDEVTSALFAYSPALHMDAFSTAQPPTTPVAQVDLVPTLALALGVPIPYSSLGTVFTPLLLTKGLSPEEALEKQVKALSRNVQQVEEYLKEYQRLGNTFPQDMWEKITQTSDYKDHKDFEKVSLREKKSTYIKYLSLAKLTCEEIWAKFNVVEMLSGLSLMASVLVLMASILMDASQQSLCNTKLIYLTLGINAMFVLLPFIGLSVIGFLGSSAVITWVYMNALKFNFNFLPNDAISLSMIFVFCMGSFSNSYVITENYTIAFICVSISVVQCLVVVTRKSKKKQSVNFSWKSFKSSLNFRNVICFGVLLAIMMAVRWAASYWKCREEQDWCVPSLVHTPMTGLPDTLKNWRYLTSLVSLVALLWLPRRWLMTCGNMNGSRVGVFLVNTIPIVCGLLIASHWALQAAPQVAALKYSSDMPARLVYGLTLLLVAALCVKPMLIYEVLPKRDLGLMQENPYSSVPQLYHKLVRKYNEGSSESQNIPVVYGLATSISAPVLSVVVAVLVVAVMLAGDGTVPAILLFFTTIAGSLLLHSITAWITAESLDGVIKPTWAAVCTWFALSVHGFFITGHQPTFPALHWSAAFVGFSGDWGGSNVVPTLLVGFNTFSSHILVGLSLPLLILAPLAVGVLFPKLRGNRLEGEEVSRGEFLLVDQPHRAKDALAFTALAYLFLHALKVLCSAAAAFLLRRHLMVWKIFAPHLIFEAVGLLVSCTSVLLGLAFVHRVLHSLLAWSDGIRQKTN